MSHCDLDLFERGNEPNKVNNLDLGTDIYLLLALKYHVCWRNQTTLCTYSISCSMLLWTLFCSVIFHRSTKQSHGF